MPELSRKISRDQSRVPTPHSTLLRPPLPAARGNAGLVVPAVARLVARGPAVPDRAPPVPADAASQPEEGARTGSGQSALRRAPAPLPPACFPPGLAVRGWVCRHSPTSRAVHSPVHGAGVWGGPGAVQAPRTGVPPCQLSGRHPGDYGAIEIRHDMIGHDWSVGRNLTGACSSVGAQGTLRATAEAAREEITREAAKKGK